MTVEPTGRVETIFQPAARVATEWPKTALDCGDASTTETGTAEEFSYVRAKLNGPLVEQRAEFGSDQLHEPDDCEDEHGSANKAVFDLVKEIRFLNGHKTTKNL